MYNNGIQSYRKTNVITSDPVRLVIMCYEGAIDNLKLAKEKMKDALQKDWTPTAKISARIIFHSIIKEPNSYWSIRR